MKLAAGGPLFEGPRTAEEIGAFMGGVAVLIAGLWLVASGVIWLLRRR